MRVRVDGPVDDPLAELEGAGVARQLVVLHQRLHQDHRRHVGERLPDAEARVEEPQRTLETTDPPQRFQQSAHVVQVALVLAFEEPSHQREHHAPLLPQNHARVFAPPGGESAVGKPVEIEEGSQRELPLADLHLLAAQVCR